MRRATSSLSLAVAMVGALGGCEARISGAPAELHADAAKPVTDSAIPSDSPGVVQLGPWSTPHQVPPASGPPGEEDDTMSSNTLELFFAIDPVDPTDPAGKHLFYTSRPTVNDPWADASPLPFDNPLASNETPRLSADDRTLYFASGRSGNLDIFKATRTAPGSVDWSRAVPVPVSTTMQAEKWFAPCQDGRYVMVQSIPNGQADLVEGVVGGPAATPIDELNSLDNETGALLSTDCLTIYFASTRSGLNQLYRAQRASPTARWAAPSRVTDFASIGGNQEDPWIAPDGKTFAFVSDAAGDKEVYLSTRSAVLGAR